MSETLMDWLFVRMAAEFGSEWDRMYNAKRTRLIKAAKADWARWLAEFDKDVLEEAVERARRAGNVPPSARGMWGFATAVKARRARERSSARTPEVGESAIASARAILAGGGQ